MSSESPAKINLVCIVKNGEATLERLIDSASKFVDEVIIVDTGSSDNTVALAKAKGASLHHFEWINDFSAARNFAFEQSDADWNLVLDADEWIEEGGAFLGSLAGQKPERVFQICIKNYQEGGVQIDHHWVQRIFPKGMRYTGIIHEQVEHNLPVEKSELHAGHDGFTQENLESKKGRNTALLKQALKENPTDPYLWFQLGRQAVVEEDYSVVVGAFQQYLMLNPNHRQALGELHQAVNNTVFALKKLKKHEDGLNFGMDFLDDCRHCPDVLFAIGDLLIDWSAESPELAPQLLPHAVDAFNQCLEMGDKPDVPGSVLGRGSELAQHNLDLIRQYYPQAFNS